MLPAVLCCAAQGMRILDYACELAAEHADQPLGLWARMEQEVKVSHPLG